jgi:hypothetical protein
LIFVLGILKRIFLAPLGGTKQYVPFIQINKQIASRCLPHGSTVSMVALI